MTTKQQTREIFGQFDDDKYTGLGIPSMDVRGTTFERQMDEHIVTRANVPAGNTKPQPMEAESDTDYGLRNMLMVGFLLAVVAAVIAALTGG